MAAEIEPQARRNILRLVETYCEATGFKVSGVSRRAHGDAGFFDLLKNQEQKHRKFGHRTDKKGSVTLRVYDQLISWFTTNWPPDTEFPELHDLMHSPKKLASEAPSSGTASLLKKLRGKVG